MYLERLKNEQLEEGETNPIKFGINPFFELELSSLNNLSFAVADNPFFRTDTPKYIPEVYLISTDGEVLAKFGPEEFRSPNFDLDENFSSGYRENFRDVKMKINDDKKIVMNLSDFWFMNDCTDYMLVMTVRAKETKKGDEKKYKDAWYRL